MVQSKRNKPSFDQVLSLVSQLSPSEQEQLRLELNRKSGYQFTSNTESHSFLDRRTTVEELVSKQAVPACQSISTLKGEFWPEDEDLDEFISTVRQWRKESSDRK